MYKTKKEMFTVAWEGEARKFTDRNEAKAFFEECKKEHYETVLRKTITIEEELVYGGNGLWF